MNIPKCNRCKEELLYSELGWLHSPETTCDCQDGVFFDQEARQLWNKQYGSPEIGYKTVIKDIEIVEKNLLEEYTKWKKQKKQMENKIQELQGENKKCHIKIKRTQENMQKNIDSKILTKLKNIMKKIKKKYWNNTKNIEKKTKTK